MQNTEEITAANNEQLVTFNVAEEIYGVEVMKVHEIIGMTQITAVPNTLSFMKGVINLRGTVVPVIDMRKKLRISEKDYDQFTVIIILEIKEQLVGLVVDGVSDVLSLPVSDIQETPHFSANIDTDYISGIAKNEEELIIILNAERLLSEDEMEQIQAQQ